MSTKGFVGFLKFCLELELFAKIKKYLVSTHSQKPGLSITQDLNKTLKISHTLLQTFVRRKRVQNFSKKIIDFTVVGARQSFQVFRKITWFLGNTRAMYV